MKDLLLVLSLALLVVAYPEEDRVTTLPGYGAIDGFRMYSGYLDIAGGKHLHYIFVESQSNPAHDPVVLWFNGGPGCSSLLGFAQEHGPYVMPDGQKTFTMTKNEYSWNKVANMIYIESPAGVGYSYSDTAKPSYTDETAADDNYLTVKALFDKFPEFKDHDLYISGESYAGVYVPFLAHRIAVDNVGDNSLKLKGIIIGNGVTDLEYDSDGLWGAAFWHGIIDKKLEEKLRDNYCFPHELSIYISPTKDKTPLCDSLYEEVIKKMAGINIYDFYRKCWYPEDVSQLLATNDKGVTY